MRCERHLSFYQFIVIDGTPMTFWGGGAVVTCAEGVVVVAVVGHCRRIHGEGERGRHRKRASKRHGDADKVDAAIVSSTSPMYTLPGAHCNLPTLGVQNERGCAFRIREREGGREAPGEGGREEEEEAEEEGLYLGGGGGGVL